MNLKRGGREQGKQNYYACMDRTKYGNWNGRRKKKRRKREILKRNGGVHNSMVPI